MKNKYLFLRGKTYVLLFATGIFLFGSCTQAIDGSNFDSGVHNTTLNPPTITAIANADGSKTVLSWPVIMGAGGIKMSLYDINEPSVPIAIVTDTIIDGSTCELPRAEDTNYKLVVKAIGNEKYNNKDSEETEFLFTSIVPKINATPIPAGTDISQWFADNKTLIEAQTEEYAIELIGGAEYIMTDEIELGNVLFNLRSDSKVNNATIKMGENAGFITETGIKMKYVNFECSGMTGDNSSILKFSKNHSYDLTAKHYLIGSGKSVVFQNCNIKGLVTRMIWDQKEPYVFDNMLIKKCIIEQDQNAQLAKGAHTIELSNSFPMTFALEGSTVYSTTSTAKGKYVYFVAYMSDRPQNLVNGLYPTCTINWFNNTMVNMTKSTSGQKQGFANWGKLKGQKVCIMNVRNNIFVDCSGNYVVRQSFTQGQQTGMVQSYEKNCYWYNGASTGSVDWNMNDRVDFDPQLTQTAEGIYKVGGAEVKAAGIGDPRGLQ